VLVWRHLAGLDLGLFGGGEALDERKLFARKRCSLLGDQQCDEGARSVSEDLKTLDVVLTLRDIVFATDEGLLVPKFSGERDRLTEL
jgi:hypothetical protein